MTQKRMTGYTAQSIELRSAEGAGKPRIEGYAIVFGQRSLPMGKENGKPVYEVIEPSAVDSALLDRCDIRMTINHDNNRLLARSKQGSGTLTYAVDGKGVRFSFDPPATIYGEEARELVSRGDIDGCSFVFSSPYGSKGAIKRVETGEAVEYRVCKIDRVYDFCLTAMPCYPDTECELRSAMSMPDEAPGQDAGSDQIREMRMIQKRPIY